MAEPGRQIVFAVDLREDSHWALLWLLKHIYKPGDTIHLVHVAKLKDETPEIFHGPAGTSFHYREHTQEQTEADLDRVKQAIASSFNKDLETAGVAHQTHLFLEGENAPAADVAAIIHRVYDEVNGCMLVASRSNKTRTQKWFLGSVAESLSRLQHPLVLVVTNHSTQAD